MLRNEFKLNLTSLILLVGFVFLFVVCIRQCSDKKDLRKSYKNRISEFVTLESNIVHDYEKEKKVLYDSIRSLNELIKTKKPRKRRVKFKAQETLVKDKVDEIPLNNHYDLAIGSYSFSDALETPINKTISLEDSKYKEKIENLDEENKFLMLSLQESGNIHVEQQKELMALESSMQQLELKLQDEALKNRALKRKVWTNRTIAGGSIIIAILVAL